MRSGRNPGQKVSNLRPPLNHTQYLPCFYPCSNGMQQGWNSCFLYNSMRLTNDKSILEVTHWMPLPESPE